MPAQQLSERRKSPAEGSSVAAPYSANTPVIALDSDGSAAVSVTVPRDIIVLAVAVVAVRVSWATDTNPEAWSFKVYPLPLRLPVRTQRAPCQQRRAQRPR